MIGQFISIEKDWLETELYIPGRAIITPTTQEPGQPFCGHYSQEGYMRLQRDFHKICRGFLGIEDEYARLPPAERLKRELVPMPYFCITDKLALASFEEDWSSGNMPWANALSEIEVEEQLIEKCRKVQRAFLDLRLKDHYSTTPDPAVMHRLQSVCRSMDELSDKILEPLQSKSATHHWHGRYLPDK